jgi:hypothetical protein
MRTLFVSERRCVSSLFRMKWNYQIHSAPLVLTETIAEPPNPRRRPWFNCDFILDFVDYRTFTSERSAAACSVLPNALGAELFLVVEKATLLPTALELNGGRAFSMKHYASYIDVVEAAIEGAMVSARGRNVGLPWNGLSQVVSIERAAFARVLVVGSDVTFLYCPNETTPVVRGQRFSLVQADDREIDCYAEGKDIICFDGWIRTEVASSERVLVSVPREKMGTEKGAAGKG